MSYLLPSCARVICILYTTTKIIHLKTNPHFRFGKVFSTIVLFIISIISQHKLAEAGPIISILAFYLYWLYIAKSKYDYTFVIVCLSHALYYFVNNIASLLTTLLVIPFYFTGFQPPYIMLFIITGICTYLFIFLIFKIKRVQSATNTLTHPKYFFTFITICIVIISLKCIDSFFLHSSQYLPSLPFYLATILLALLLFTWWRKQITKSYIEKLRKLEVQSLYDELEEKERLIKKLTADNQSLSRIIHKDNKLIPAMEQAVTDFLSGSQEGTPESLRQYGLELTEKLREMAQDRQGILDSYESESHKLKLTGHVSLDAMLVYMQKKALTNHITFECKHSPETIDYLLSKISEEDLTHILSDLAENALIAMNKQTNGRLQITFGKLEKEAYIAIADTGIPFDLATLHSFGLRPHTTHEDSGGSGIGLMDIWNIKRKYRATIQIQEYAPENASFTKRILFSFNAKNHYVIQSFRHAEISNTQTRGDLYVIPSDAKENNEGKQHERIN